MKVSIPLYIEEKKEAGSRSTFLARPLFTAEPVRIASSMDRVVNRVSQDIRGLMAQLGRAERHESLSAFTFCPEIDDKVLELPLDLKKGSCVLRLLIATFPWMGRTVAFSPTVPGVWFDLERGESLTHRATEVYTAHYRAEGYSLPAGTARTGLSGSAWVTSVTFEIQPRRQAVRTEDPRKLSLVSGEARSGDLELLATGTCLSWADSDSLGSALGREKEVDELDQLLTGPSRRAVLLLGPRQVGKTALVHEVVRVRARRRRQMLRSRRNVWHLSPQRLISGMSFVGQWEQRVLAIVQEASRQDHVLYFDDVLGLYTAGMSASSDLSIAQVMRTYVEKRAFRFLAEMTPEAFRVLKELDRGFADRFHVVPVRETTHQETLEIGIGLQRELEARHLCRFDLEALPTAQEVVARQSRDAAFPGKLASFLTHIAVKFAGSSAKDTEIGRREVLAEFEAKTGLVTAFLDDRLAVTRESVVASLRSHVVGQSRAVEAMADAVMVARARLADPGRPLASLLMLGPTGVGKTQCARALANHLFGDLSRMLRLDMNEYNASGSASRLVGTLYHPEGTLTAAVRRQPFAVLLLDEIEKAHPEVLDLLLQVLGDGRLTDGRGRTSDFGNCIVVMTSNLGAREVRDTLGFGAEQRDAGAIYRRAAERFFRPELFNRIDRVIPFDRLDRAAMERVAGMLIGSVLRRGGLVDRRCLLSVEPAALARIVDAGFDTELGARALRRVVEARIAQAVADRLAGLPRRVPTLVRVEAGSGDTVEVVADVLSVTACSAAGARSPGADLTDVEARLGRIEERLVPMAPEGDLEAGKIGPAALHYFSLREQLVNLERWFDALANRRPRSPSGRPPPPRPSTRDPVRLLEGEIDWSALLCAESPRQHLATLTEGARRTGEALEDRLRELSGEVALLEKLVAAGVPGSTEAVLVIRSMTGAPAAVLDELEALYREAFGGVREASPRPEERIVRLEGPSAAAHAALEIGTQLFFLEGGGFLPVRVGWRGAGDRELPPVIRFHAGGSCVDVRSRLVLPRFPDASDLRLMRVLGEAP